jgi:hypothetical protein
MYSLYSNLSKLEYDAFILQAKLHGAEFEDKGENTKTSSKEVKTSSFLFGDPAEYETLPPEERENLTLKMMAKHKDWSSSALNKKGK